MSAHHYSTESEQSVLGALLVSGDAWDEVADVITAADFYREDHRLLFSCIGALIERNQPVDAVTVASVLESRGELDQVGGLAYIGQLAKNCPTAANARAYANVIRERAAERRLLVATQDAAGVLAGTGTSAEKIEQVERLMSDALDATAPRGELRSARDIMSDVVDEIDRAFHADNPITGVASGFTDFDRMTAGLQGGDLIVVAARPSMGKTAFACNIARSVAQLKIPSAFFSMEMEATQLVKREAAALAHLDHDLIRSGQLTDEHWPHLTRATAALAELPLFIDHSPSLSITDLRARARRYRRKHRIGLIVVDYIQLMRAKAERREQEIAAISAGLKALAKELHVPVIALSQLNRSLEQRPDKRPKLSDLRESGAIEQDADLVCFLYRDDVYNEQSEYQGCAELIIAKHRNGRIGWVPLTFQGQYCRFDNFAGEWPQPAREQKPKSRGFNYGGGDHFADARAAT